MKSTLETQWYLIRRTLLKNGLYKHIFRTGTKNNHEIVIECHPLETSDRLLYSLPKGATFADKRL